MAHESIYNLRRPGFPKESVDSGSYRTNIEYVGIASDLRAASPNINDAWGEYNGAVSLAELIPDQGNPDYAILTIWVERKFDEHQYGFADDAEDGAGKLDSTVHEIDWVSVQRNMYEHPEFQVGKGGAHQLTKEDLCQIKAWEGMPLAEYKKDFIFPLEPDTYKSGDRSAGTSTLSANAQLFAQGINLGIEYWEDLVPVARQSEKYLGGPGPKGKAGLKETPTGFPNLPSGYEWIRSADRSIQSGGQAEWQRSIEWLGSDKVLVDSKHIYWTL